MLMREDINLYLTLADDYPSPMSQIIGSVLLVMVLLYLVSEFSSPSGFAPLYASPVLGSDLRYLVHKTFTAAVRGGSLVQTNVSFPPQVVESKGIEVMKHHVFHNI